jgi:hypothetical protein
MLVKCIHTDDDVDDVDDDDDDDGRRHLFRIQCIMLVQHRTFVVGTVI